MQSMDPETRRQHDDTDRTDRTRTAAGAAGDGKLVVVSGPGRGRVYALGGERTRIGRAAHNDVVIDSMNLVSATHAEIWREPSDGAWWIADRGSKNGTFVNDARIDRARLRDGDAITFARNGPEARFTLGEPSLPGLFETTVKTLRRTRSIESALRELLPAGIFPSATLEAGGMARLLDDRLEKHARRTRRWVLGGLAAALLAAAAVGLGVGLGLVPPRSPSAAAGVELSLDPEIEPIYSSSFFSTRAHPIGRVVVSNRGRRALAGLELRFVFLREAEPYLAEPYLAPIDALAPGESKTVALKPRIAAAIRSPRTHEVSALFSVHRGGEVLKEAVRAVYVHGYNVFNWEEPRRITSFVDPQDRAVRAFAAEALRSRGAAGEAEAGFPPRPWRDGAALVGALAALGLRYQPDAASPASETIDSRVSDQVRFPWETLAEGRGDCDDLAVLCASALESAGIASALVVAPTHVFLMFESGLASAQLEAAPIEPESVIDWQGRLWVPIEPTVLAEKDGGFLAAWDAAAPRRQAIAGGECQVVPVREGWKQFPPPLTRKEIDDLELERLLSRRWAAEDLPQRLEAERAQLLRRFQEAEEKKARSRQGGG